MPSKKKKYNARFPAGRIKKIMQSDEEIGKVAQAVPVIISRTLELFVESLLTKTLRITNSRNAKTLSTSHMKQCIMSEQRFDFLRELVKNVPDISVAEEAANYNEEDGQTSPEEVYPDSDTPYDLSMPSTSGVRHSMRNVQTPNRPNGGGGGGSGSQSTTTPYVYKPRQNGSAQALAANTEIDLTRHIRHRGGGGVQRSVITHTACVTESAVASATSPNYVQPLRLMRSESTPANTANQQTMWHVAPHAAIPPQQQQQQHHQQHGQKRLHHQTQSLPSSSNNGGCCYTSLQKSEQQPQQQQQTHHSQTAIPAPVFSYDLCNKPVVKIDYSHLQLPPALPGSSTSTSEHHSTIATATATAPAVNILPLSAPVCPTASFNFDAAAPIINIDLTNIVTDGSNKTTATPAIATISIGALPVDLANIGAAAVATNVASLGGTMTVPPPATMFANPPLKRQSIVDSNRMEANVTTKTTAAAAAAAVDSTSSAGSSSSCSPSSSSSSAVLASMSASAFASQQGVGTSKSSLKTTTEIMANMTAAAAAAAAATTCKNSNTFLELDEDYDNI